MKDFYPFYHVQNHRANRMEYHIPVPPPYGAHYDAIHNQMRDAGFLWVKTINDPKTAQPIIVFTKEP